ncbi:MAG: glycoside hydrolase family 28 protein [Lentisphaerae bacterium]|nr:MAG: glycoside hydrolase family 28 protein [Lentisphaerota bacterium]
MGARGNGSDLDTPVFQQAIDKLAEQGGGRIHVPAGKYVIGTIKLKSGVELYLDDGAELLGSLSLQDYARDIEGAVEAPEFNPCLIYAEQADNLSLCGPGCVDGRGTREHFPPGSRGQKLLRPMLIRFVRCRNVRFEDVTLRDAGAWCTHLVECDDVTIRGVTIRSRVNVNNDGFDLDGCANVLIENCDLQTGDDAICPKSTTLKMCENIRVRNCRISSNTAAFKCGTSSRGGFHNIRFSHCQIHHSRMGVIKLLIVDGGTMENVEISDLEMVDVEGPIFIRLGNRGRPYDVPMTQIQHANAAHEGVPPGRLRNIHIHDIDAMVTSDDRSRWGIMITGIPGHCVEDIRLENVKISFPGGGTVEEAKRVVPEDETRYPEQFFFGVLPSWGAYLRHIRGIRFHNVHLTTRQPDARERLCLVDVEDFTEENPQQP